MAIESLDKKIGLPPRLREMQLPEQADSIAATIGDLVTDFNALLAKLRESGLMKS